MIENEFKVMLTKEQYEKIFEAFTWDGEIAQTNHYFDTEDLSLSDRGITVRVREVYGDFIMQLKLPTSTKYARVEVEQKVDELPEDISADTLLKLSGEALPDVKRIGALFTKRLFTSVEGAELDLDLSNYFNKHDYEVEIEFSDETAARELLDKVYEIIGDKSSGEVCRGKMHRFMDEYRMRNV